MVTVNLRSFRQIARHNKKRIRSFLTRLEKKAPRGLDRFVVEADKSAWTRTNCLDCANCCKTMSPTYTKKDVIRIAQHLGMTEKAFREKWLYKDKSGDWMNVKQPCQFLDLNTNMCGVYEVRPADCAGFPHHTKKRMVDYMHMYKQNIEYCPATYRVVEMIMEKAGHPLSGATFSESAVKTSAVNVSDVNGSDAKGSDAKGSDAKGSPAKESIVNGTALNGSAVNGGTHLRSESIPDRRHL